MRIAVFIASQQKSFLISTAQLLARDHEVSIVAYDANVANLVRRLAPELAASMLIQSEMNFPVPPGDAVGEARRMEERYGVRMSLMTSKDRALGRGYIFNADCYPDVGRSWWSHERKTAEMVSRFLAAEGICDALKPDLLIGLQKFTEIFCVARARNIKYYSPAPVKLGSRYIVSDDEYLLNPEFLRTIETLAASGAPGGEELETYEQEAGSKFNHGQLSYSWTRVAKDVLRQCVGEAKKIVRGRVDKDSYRLFGWVPSLVRRKLMHDAFCRFGKRPEELRDYRLVYVPLHLEPEIALLGVSPEFNNSMEMIAWISKSVPADTLLVVKEQPFAFGVRSRRYYDMLRRIGNVVFAHPATSSWTWIEASDLVAVFTGTAGTEAVNMGRPVLSFGMHQAINLLPTVRFADSYRTTHGAVEELLALDKDGPLFAGAKWALRKAQTDCSFDLAGFERTFPSLEPQPELAARFVAGLVAFDPELGKPGQ